jgi:hypothetical protein
MKSGFGITEEQTKSHMQMLQLQMRVMGRCGIYGSRESGRRGGVGLERGCLVCSWKSHPMTSSVGCLRGSVTVAREEEGKRIWRGQVADGMVQRRANGRRWSSVRATMLADHGLYAGCGLMLCPPPGSECDAAKTACLQQSHQERT